MDQFMDYYNYFCNSNDSFGMEIPFHETLFFPLPKDIIKIPWTHLGASSSKLIIQWKAMRKGTQKLIK